MLITAADVRWEGVRDPTPLVALPADAMDVSSQPEPMPWLARLFCGQLCGRRKRTQHRPSSSVVAGGGQPSSSWGRGSSGSDDGGDAGSGEVEGETGPLLAVERRLQGGREAVGRCGNPVAELMRSGEAILINVQ